MARKSWIGQRIRARCPTQINRPRSRDASAASTATAAITSAVTDAFCDYVADAVFDSVASSLPFGLGAIKSGSQVAQVSVRIVALRGQILTLKGLAR